ncbi:Insulin-like 3 [Myotis brandtii]|uniref:Insulin-like 3 n=1 Tax=Myotis brandtii TaxID=109478 RepID=S7N5R5_MYOBR|nr:Insulin-like 3 [Myotis brandtii]
MDPRPLPWALVLLSSALVGTLGRAPTPEGPEKLCGHHFVRALVRVCGGPRWSPETGRPVTGGDQGVTQVSCCNGWKDDISSMAWWPRTKCWYSTLSPCPRPLTITTTTTTTIAGQLPPTLPATAALAAAPGKTY